MRPLTAFDLSHSARRLRGLWMALALMFLAVQLGLPAHEAGHPIGQPETACHYCMLGGHSPGMPNATLPPQTSETKAIAPLIPVVAPASQNFTRTYFSRGPPHSIDV